MKQVLTSILIVLGACFQSFAGEPGSVNRFYSGLKTLENATNLNVANEAQQTMAACFMASELGGIELSVDELGEMSSNTYTQKLFMMIYNRKSLKVSYVINGTELVEQPDQTGKMQKQGARHYVTYVTKKYTMDGKTTTYYDKVFTFIDNGLITEMINSKSSGKVQTPTMTSTTTKRLNVEQLRARAAYYYSNKQYEEAYKCYEQLIDRAPTDGDAAYRIALLTFWRKGCKNRFSKKAAQNKAMKYIELAIRYGDSEIREKATNVRANWKNRNVYF